jgi:hypothetical protein
MIGEDVVRFSRCFIGEGGEGDQHRDVLARAPEAEGIGKFEHGVDAVDEQNLELAVCHLLHEVLHFLGRGGTVIFRLGGSQRGEIHAAGLAEIIHKGVEGEHGFGNFQVHCSDQAPRRRGWQAPFG